jgi:hypothetical protein
MAGQHAIYCCVGSRGGIPGHCCCIMLHWVLLLLLLLLLLPWLLLLFAP